MVFGAKTNNGETQNGGAAKLIENGFFCLLERVAAAAAALLTNFDVEFLHRSKASSK